eukprot:tig00000980_g6126.t1
MERRVASRTSRGALVLRIKRKLNDLPLDSILVEEPMQQKRSALSALATAASGLALNDAALSADQADEELPALETERARTKADAGKRFLRRIYRRIDTLTSSSSSLLESTDWIQAKVDEIRNRRTRVIPIPGTSSRAEQQQGNARAARLKSIQGRRITSNGAESTARASCERIMMCNYMPMVREYLAADVETTSAGLLQPLKAPSARRSRTAQPVPSEETSDEYVYDVYLFDGAEPSDDATSPRGTARYDGLVRIETFDEELASCDEYDSAGQDDSDSNGEQCL